MARFYLEFNEQDAYAYQAELAEQMYQAQKKILENLQHEELDSEAMQCFMDGQNEFWEPMQKFLRMPNPEEIPKKIEFQKLVLQFLKAKKMALRLMTLGSKRPQSWAMQHFNEIEISEKMTRLYPVRGPKVLEAIYDRLRMFQENGKTKIFLVRTNYLIK